MSKTQFRGALAVPILVVASSLLLAPAPSIAQTDKATLQRSLVRAQQTATNGILSIQIENASTSSLGRFSVTTGANHPHPNQQVLYPVGTSYITFRDATDQVMWVPGSASSAGLTGYTLQNMNVAPGSGVVTSISNGYRTTWTLPNWTVVQDVQINGTTLNDTNVIQKVTVTNTSNAPRQYGLRYMWDWEIAGNDASVFRPRNPDGAFTSTFTTYAPPAFALFEESNSASGGLFSVFATVGGGSLSPVPTQPDQLRYSSWGTSYSSAWDFANTGGNSDSSTVHYWGFNNPLTLAAGASATYVEYLTTQISAVGGGGVPATVPTLSQWGLLILATLVGLSAIVYARRRAR